MVELDEAQLAIALARRAIVARLGPNAPTDPAVPYRNDPMPAVFAERRGVFVTLKQHPSGRLRGCIGYPLPVHPLRTAIPRIAVAAALDDPRFPPVGRGELAGLRLEISVLTPPRPLESNDAAGRLSEVQVGRDGLLVESGGESGLLLPQVPVEEGWDAATFLTATCEKAGLPDSAWERPEVAVYRFEAEVFAETTPLGSVAAVPLTPASVGGRGRRG